MDYYEHLLVDPVEVDDEIIDPFPDKFRSCLFNKPGLVLPENASDRAKMTSTQLKYWTCSEKILIEQLIKMLKDYYNLETHSLTAYLKNGRPISQEIMEYYNKIYNLTDIIISRNLIVTATQVCLNNTNSNNHVCFRITVYLAAYLIKFPKCNMDRFITTVINKLKEFKQESRIGKYFTDDELDEYIVYINRLK